MAVCGRLLVERGNYDAPSQDWGEYEFLGLPSPGDRIAARYEDDTHFLTVLCVHHQPVAVQVGERSGGDRSPRAEVVAKWTGKQG